MPPADSGTIATVLANDMDVMRRPAPNLPAHATLTIGLLAVVTSLWLGPVAARGQAVPILEPPSFVTSMHEVKSLSFLNSVLGWVVIENHERQQSQLFVTNDGGKGWKGRGIPSGIFQVSFVNSRLGWALKLTQGKEPDEQTFYLLRTEDGGRNWKDALSRPIVESHGVWQGSAKELAFADSLHGLVIGAGLPVTSQPAALVMRTIDGGRTVQRVDEVSKFLGASWGLFASREAGLWVYGEGYVIHSSDFGKTWESPLELSPLVAYPFLPRSILLRPTGRGWLSGTSMKAFIWGTNDFGKHWREEIEMGNYLSFDNLTSWDDDHACATMNSDLFCTANGGSTWKQKKEVLVTSPGSGVITKLVILPSGRGWFLCQGGLLYQTDDAGQTWVTLDLVDSADSQNQPQ